MKVDLYHNIRWSRYKAAVFSELYRAAKIDDELIRFIHVADTSGQRKALSAVDLSWHQYPHRLLFQGDYDQIPRRQLYISLFMSVLRSDADLVLIQGFDQPEHWLMLLAAIVSRKKRAAFCDSTLNDRKQNRIKGLLKRLFFSRCSGVFCYGDRAREYLLHYGVPPERIIQRYQAAALPSNYREDDIFDLRESAANGSDNPGFLYVGRLSEEKGLNTLVDAFSSVKTKLSKARLVIVGGGHLEQTLKKKVASLALDGSVEFAGGMPLEALSQHYLKATCLILPSESEPWGLVVNEALHYGCPVVVSDRCGCVPELVKDGVSGYAFPANDVEALSNKLLQMVADASDTQAVARRCLDVVRPYNPTTAATQILKGCRAMLGERRHS